MEAIGFNARNRPADDLAKTEHTEQQERHRALQLRLANINNRLSRLTDAYLDGNLEKADLEQRKEALLMERRQLEDQVERRDIRPRAAETLAEFLELADRGCLLYEKALPQEHRELIDIVTSNRIVDGRTPQFRWISPLTNSLWRLKREVVGHHQSEFELRRLATVVRHEGGNEPTGEFSVSF